MIWSDVLRAISMAALAVTAAANGPVLLVTLLAFTTTAFGTAYVPSMMAITPTLVGEDDLAAANALDALVANLTIVIGPAVGRGAARRDLACVRLHGELTDLPGYHAAAHVRTRGVHERKTDDGASETGAFVAHFLEGVREISRSAGARILAAFLLGVAFVYGAQTVALVLVSDERLGTGRRRLRLPAGRAGGGWGDCGAVGQPPGLGPPLAPTLLTGIGLAALPMAALCLVHSPVVAAALMVVSRAGATAVDVLTVTLLQRALPDELRGRVFGLLDSGIVLAILAGSVIVSPLVSLLGLSGMLISLGLGVSALAVVGVHRTVQLDGKPRPSSMRSRPSSSCCRAFRSSSSRHGRPSSSSPKRRRSKRWTRGGWWSRRATPPMTSTVSRAISRSTRWRPTAPGRRLDRWSGGLFRRDRPHSLGAPHHDRYRPSQPRGSFGCPERRSWMRSRRRPRRGPVPSKARPLASGANPSSASLRASPDGSHEVHLRPPCEQTPQATVPTTSSCRSRCAHPARRCRCTAHRTTTHPPHHCRCGGCR